MKKLITFTLLCTMSCLFGISQNDNNILKYDKDIKFPTGFQAHASFSGVFYQDNEPYYYFGELISRKVIKVFDKDANLVKDISLKGTKYLDLAKNMNMIAMDSIIIALGDPVQVVFLANSNGEIFFEKHFPQYIITDTIDFALDSPFDLHTPFYNNSVYLQNNALKQIGYHWTTT